MEPIKNENRVCEANMNPIWYTRLKLKRTVFQYIDDRVA